MPERLSSSPTSTLTAVSIRTASFYVDSELYILEADWNWEMEANAIFCSDVMMPADPEFFGTRGIFHPEDLVLVKSALAQLAKGDAPLLSFRMITTYGEVKHVSAEKVYIQEVEEKEPVDLNFNFLRKAMQEIQAERNQDRSVLYKSMLDQFERMNASGSWFFNSSTGETEYSDQMFRLFELMPGSLNAHAHTFTQFIDTVDQHTVTETVDKAFQSRVPLHIQYRILLPSGVVKQVIHFSEWMHNHKGELVQIGMLRDNTAQHQTEVSFEAAAHDNTFHRQLLQLHERAASSGYWYTNLLTRQSYFSDNYYRIHGLKPQSLPASVGLLENSIHPDDIEKMQNALHKMRSLQIAPELDYRIIRADGRIRYISQKAKLIVYGGDELIMCVVIHDVTDSRLINQKMNELDEKVQLQDLMHSQSEEVAGIGSWIWDIEADKMDFSLNMCKILGYKRKTDIDYNNVLRAVHSGDRKKFLDEFTVVTDQRSNAIFNIRLLIFGEVKHVKVFTRMIEHQGRKLLLSTFQEINHSIESGNRLHETLQITQVLTDSLLDAVFISDANNNIVMWNRGAELLFGKTEAEIIATNYFDKFPDQRNDERIRDFNNVLADNKVIKKELRLSNKKLHNMYMIPLKGQDEKVTGILHAFQDVTTEATTRNTLTERILFIEKLLEQTVDRIIVLDKNMNYKLFNRKAEQYYRINSEYLIGKHILDVYPGLVDEPIYHMIRRGLKGESIHIPTTENKETGRHEETYLIPLFDDRNQVTGILWVVHDFTNDVILEKHSRKSVEIFNSLNESYLELDEDGTIIFINYKACEYFTKSAEDVLGKTLWHIFPEHAASDFFTAIRESLNTRVAVTQEFYMAVTKTHVVASIAPTVDGVIVAFTDIEFLKEAEQKLKYFNDQLAIKNKVYNYAEEIASLGTWMWNSQTNEFSFSDNMFRLFGFEPQDQITKLAMFKEFVHPADVQIVEEVFTLITGGDKHATTEFRIIRKDGVERTLASRMEALMINGVQHIVGTTQDVSEYKQVQRALEEEHSRLAEAQQISHLGSFEYDPNNCKLIWSEELYRIYGLDPNGEQITIEKVIEMTHPNDVDYFSELIKKSSEAPANINFNHQIIRADGTVRMINRNVTSYADNSGKVVSVKGTVHDITDLYEREVAEKTSRLLMQKKDEFIGIASHELKTPIATLYLSMQLLQKALQNMKDESIHHVLNTSIRQVHKLNALVNELRDVDAIQTGKIRLYKTDFNICEFITSILEDLKSVTEGVSISVDCKNDLRLYADKSRIEQVITNLVTNAIKYSDEDKAVKIQVIADAKQTKFLVTDNGIGISMQHQEKLFDSYFRIEETATHAKGQGLGLFIAKELIRKHGGDIGVESTPGDGSTFWFCIPHQQ
jgi:PAS domain S-box-containing protein